MNDSIEQKIMNRIIEYKINNKNINSITLGYNQAMELKKLVDFKMPISNKCNKYIGSFNGVRIFFKNQDDYFEVDEEL